MRAKSLLALLGLIAALALAPAQGVAAPAHDDDHHAEDTAHATDDHADGDHAGDAHDDGHHGDDHHGGHAAGEASPIAGWKEGTVSTITTLIVFAVVFVFLYLRVWPKIVKGLDERNEKIASEIEAAEAARRQAKDALEEYEKNLAEARAEAQAMLDDAKSKQSALAAELRQKADAELGAMRAKARADIEAARKAALNDIYKEASMLATHMAGKILQREVSTADQDRLLQESLDELGASRN